MEPTVIVTPNFYNLGFTEVQFETNANLAAKYEDVGELMSLFFRNDDRNPVSYKQL